MYFYTFGPGARGVSLIGGGGGGSIRISKIKKPYFSDKDIQCIAISNFQKLRILEKNVDITIRFCLPERGILHKYHTFQFQSQDWTLYPKK